MITIVGSYVSPYVRKVLACLEFKGISYQIDPIVPFYGNDAFSSISPVRRIPVLIDGDLKLPDSTVICEYLEDRYPGVAMYPRDPTARAQSRWIEEYADSRMGEVFIWRLFNQLVINRFVWGEKKDETVLQQSLTQEIPEILKYLEDVLPARGYLFEDLSVADVAVAAFFRNIALANSELDLSNAPNTASFVVRILGLDCLACLRKFEEISMTHPIPQHRQALLEAGAPIAEISYFQPEPRRGILSI